MRSLSALLLAVACALPRPALAQDEDLSGALGLLQEEDLVESAGRHKQRLVETPVAVTVLTREDLLATGAQTLDEALFLVPGLLSSQWSPTYAGVYTRGLGTSLLLVDGREVNTEWFYVPFYELVPFSLDDIDRVEVIRGGVGALYGPNAVGTVVSVYTRHGKALRARATGGPQAAHGAPRFDGGLPFESVHASGGVGDDKKWANASVDYERVLLWERDGISRVTGDDTGRRIVRLRGDAGTPLAGGKLEGDAGASLFDGSFYSGLGDFALSNDAQPYARVRFDKGPFSAQVYYSGLYGDWHVHTDFVRDGKQLARIVDPIRLGGDTVDGQLLYTEDRIPSTLLIVGASYRFTSFRTPDLRTEPLDLRAPPGGGDLQHRAGAFAHAEVSLPEHMALVMGAREDWNNVTVPGFAFSPGAGLVWSPRHESTVHADWQRAFRKPTVLETSFHPVLVPDPNTPPELKQLIESGGANPDLPMERYDFFDVGWRGRLLADRLAIDADFAVTSQRDPINYVNHVVWKTSTSGLPTVDLAGSHIGYEVAKGAGFVNYSAELKARARPTSRTHLDLVATWQREYDRDSATGAPYLGGAFPEWQFVLGGGAKEGALTFDAFYQLRTGFPWSPRNPDTVLEPDVPGRVPGATMLHGRVEYALPLRRDVGVGLSFQQALFGDWMDGAQALASDGQRVGPERRDSRYLLYVRAEL